MAGLHGPIIDFGLLIIVGMLLGGIAIWLRQPLILAYIAAGILLGSQGLGLIGDEQYLYEIASELGIAMLLFVVGLELSIKKMMEVRKVVTLGVLSQVAIIIALGVGVGHLLGFSYMEGFYLGMAMAITSTLLLVKMLGEKHEIGTLHGRILVGSLVFEDILVIILISVLGVLAGAEPTGFVSWIVSLPGLNLIPYMENIALVFGAIVLLLSAYVLNRYVARYLFRFFSRSAEMLMLCALGFLFLVAFLAGELGFSVAIGAFVAGVIVANTDYSLDVLGRVKVLAAFFALLFFSTLGFKVTFENFTSLLVPVLAITALVLIAKPIIVGAMVRLFGYGARTSALVGLHMSQISEFSLILIAFGIKYGHVQEQVLTIIILVLLLTFVISTYYMNYAQNIISFLQRRVRFISFERDEAGDDAAAHADAVVYGVEHLEDEFVSELKETGHSAVFVDPDPEGLERLKREGHATLAGSISNEEVLEKLHVEQLRLVVSMVPDYVESLSLLDHVRKHNRKAKVILVTHTIQDALRLYEHGATYVHVTSVVEDSALRLCLQDVDEKTLARMRKEHKARLRRVGSRKSGTVGVQEAIAQIADAPFELGKQAFAHVKGQFSEIDRLVNKSDPVKRPRASARKKAAAKKK